MYVILFITFCAEYMAGRYNTLKIYLLRRTTEQELINWLWFINKNRNLANHVEITANIAVWFSFKLAAKTKLARQ